MLLRYTKRRDATSLHLVILFNYEYYFVSWTEHTHTHTQREGEGEGRGGRERETYRHRVLVLQSIGRCRVIIYFTILQFPYSTKEVLYCDGRSNAYLRFRDLNVAKSDK